MLPSSPVREDGEPTLLVSGGFRHTPAPRLHTHIAGRLEDLVEGEHWQARTRVRRPRKSSKRLQRRGVSGLTRACVTNATQPQVLRAPARRRSVDVKQPVQARVIRPEAVEQEEVSAASHTFAHAHS